MNLTEKFEFIGEGLRGIGHMLTENKIKEGCFYLGGLNALCVRYAEEYSDCDDEDDCCD